MQEIEFNSRKYFFTFQLQIKKNTRNAENLAGMSELTGQEKHAISIYSIKGIQKSKFKLNPTISDPRFSHGVIYTAKIKKFL